MFLVVTTIDKETCINEMYPSCQPSWPHCSHHSWLSKKNVRRCANKAHSLLTAIYQSVSVSSEVIIYLSCPINCKSTPIGTSLILIESSIIIPLTADLVFDLNIVQALITWFKWTYLEPKKGSNTQTLLVVRLWRLTRRLGLCSLYRCMACLAEKRTKNNLAIVNFYFILSHYSEIIPLLVVFSILRFFRIKISFSSLFSRIFPSKLWRIIGIIRFFILLRLWDIKIILLKLQLFENLHDSYLFIGPKACSWQPEPKLSHYPSSNSFK